MLCVGTTAAKQVSDFSTVVTPCATELFIFRFVDLTSFEAILHISAPVFDPHSTAEGTQGLVLAGRAIVFATGAVILVPDIVWSGEILHKVTTMISRLVSRRSSRFTRQCAVTVHPNDGCRNEIAHANSAYRSAPMSYGCVKAPPTLIDSDDFREVVYVVS